MDFDRIERIFFVGIGGIGMSALARYFKLKGKEIYGYDRVSTALSRTLEAEGMKICYIEESGCFPEDVDLVIRTPAVPAQNLFLQLADKRGIPIVKRAEALGIISKAFRSVAVAGTHGKTTTSTMISWVLRSCGIDCAAFLGGISVNFNSNFIFGNSEWVVLEADEYDRSFLQLHPELAVITSMEPDHLDIYGRSEAVSDAYRAFAGQIKSSGLLIVHDRFADLLQDLELPLITYGFEASSDYCIRNLNAEAGKMHFEIVDSVGVFSYALPYPGRHNVENACASIAVGRRLGLAHEEIAAALEGFNGIHRRFEIIAQQEGIVIIDDYAHHPTELQAAIDAARAMYPGKKLSGVFQPHLYSRTRDFCDGFATALDTLDECLLVELYPAREEPIDGVDSGMIFRRMQMERKSLCNLEDVPWRLLQMDLEVLLIMGAGNIDTAIPKIKELLIK